MWNPTEWENKFTDHIALSGEPMPGMSIVELASDNRVLIERHRGIMEYGQERIRVIVSFGQLCITGCHLELVCMTKQQLIISGKIDCITVIRRQ